MARDDRSNDQERLFPVDETDTDHDSRDQSLPEDGAADRHEPPETDLASEEERLRNGDIAFRPVSLPGSEPVTATRKSGAGGTVLMIVAAIVVVLLLTYVVNTFTSTEPTAPEPSALVPGEHSTAEESVATETPPADEPAAMFQAHAELQERYRRSESRVTELESELEALRAVSSATTPTGGASAGNPLRQTELETENRELKADLEKLRRESETTVARAEQLVARAEAQVTEEQGRTRTAREEADQARRQAEALTGERDVVTGERDSLRQQVEQLEAESSRYKADYDRLAANTTTRLEGESEAVRQLISRHSQELEEERKVTREKEAEIQRLKTLIARLSVTDPGISPAGPASTTRSQTTAPPQPSAGVDTAPRILTRREPVYPVNARRLKVEGTVLLNVLVGADGTVREVKVLEADGGKLLSPAAVDAVREWTFAPATRGGNAVQCWHKVPIRFAL